MTDETAVCPEEIDPNHPSYCVYYHKK
jgi:hypothetical protein